MRRYGKNGKFIDPFIEGLQRVEGVAAGPDGHLYVCDWQANVVNRYDRKTSALVDTFIKSGELKKPNGIAFRPEN